MVPTAQKMLAEIIKVQLSKDFSVGEKYVMDNFVWTDEMEVLSKKLKEIDKSNFTTQNMHLNLLLGITKEELIEILEQAKG